MFSGVRAIIEVVRGLFLSKLKSPGNYSEKPAEALVMFCGRYLEILVYEGSIRMCRVSMAESERFPEGAAAYFDVKPTRKAVADLIESLPKR